MCQSARKVTRAWQTTVFPKYDGAMVHDEPGTMDMAVWSQFTIESLGISSITHYNFCLNVVQKNLFDEIKCITKYTYFC